MRRSLVPTAVPGLALLPAAHDAIAPGVPLRASRKTRWLAALREIACDYLVIDTGPGHNDLALDLMLSADVAIAVTVPEPPAIETTYRFVRAMYRRRLRRVFLRDKMRSAILERALADLGPLPAPIRLVHKIAKVDKSMADEAWAEAQGLRLQLVVNQTRVRTDSDLGAWMSGLVSRHYGVHLDELGHVEHDDTVWLTVRRNKPLLVDSPASKSARNVERIARRVLALATGKSPERPIAASAPAPTEEPTLYAVLGVTRSASDEEIRRAYKSDQREDLCDRRPGDGIHARWRRARVGAAEARRGYDTLLDPVRRRAYDLSTFSGPRARRGTLGANDAAGRGR